MLKKLALLAIVLIGALFLVSSPSASAFDLFGKSCTGQGANSPVCKDAANTGNNNPISGKNGIIQVAANLVALITGIAAVIMIIVGGFTYATSAGVAEKVAAARRRIMYSLLGLAVVGLAWALTTFIISNFVNS